MWRNRGVSGKPETLMVRSHQTQWGYIQGQCKDAWGIFAWRNVAKANQRWDPPDVSVWQKICRYSQLVFPCVTRVSKHRWSGGWTHASDATWKFSLSLVWTLHQSLKWRGRHLLSRVYNNSRSGSRITSVFMAWKRNDLLTHSFFNTLSFFSKAWIEIFFQVGKQSISCKIWTILNHKLISKDPQFI